MEHDETTIDNRDMCPECHVPMVVTTWQDPATYQIESEATCPECGGTETTL